MNIVVVVEELSKDYTAIHELWVDAKNSGDFVLAEELLAQLGEINDLYLTLYKPEIHRDIRILANEYWRIATTERY